MITSFKAHQITQKWLVIFILEFLIFIFSEIYLEIKTLPLYFKTNILTQSVRS